MSLEILTTETLLNFRRNPYQETHRGRAIATNDSKDVSQFISGWPEMEETLDEKTEEAAHRAAMIDASRVRVASPIAWTNRDGARLCRRR